MSEPVETDFTETELPQVEQPVAPIVAKKVLPLGMKPAPAVKIRMSAPVDIGKWHKAYHGWMVVFDMGADMTMFDILDEVAESDSDFKKIKLMQQWLLKCLVAWNFTITDIDGETTLLPQPREGGLAQCPYELLLPLAKAFNSTIKTPNL